MYRSRSKLGFKPNSSLQEDNILSKVSTSSGIWINGSKELLRDNYQRHDYNRMPHPLQPRQKNLHVGFLTYVETLQDDEHKDEINTSDTGTATMGDQTQTYDFNINNSKSKMNSQLSTTYSEKSDWYLSPVNLKFENCDTENVSCIDSSREAEKDLEDLERKLISTNAYVQSAKISPYELRLFELRREQLKLEEAYLLKLKCEEELEKIRLPTPKWYELRTKQFTTEMEKHNSLLKKSAKDLQGLLDYRVELFQKSKDYNEFYIDS